MNAEEWTAQVDGTIHALVLACSSIIATHPEREKITTMLHSLLGHAAEATDDTATKKHFKLGIRTTTATLLEGVNTAKQAEIIRSLGDKPGGN